MNLDYLESDATETASLYRQLAEAQAEVARLRDGLEEIAQMSKDRCKWDKQPHCGHPRAAISGECTLHCRWCEDVAEARADGAAVERERLLELAKYLNKRVKVVKETARLGSIRVAGIREQWARELESIAAAIRSAEEGD